MTKIDDQNEAAQLMDDVLSFIESGRTRTIEELQEKFKDITKETLEVILSTLEVGGILERNVIYCINTVPKKEGV